MCQQRFGKGINFEAACLFHRNIRDNLPFELLRAVCPRHVECSCLLWSNGDIRPTHPRFLFCAVYHRPCWHIIDSVALPIISAQVTKDRSTRPRRGLSDAFRRCARRCALTYVRTRRNSDACEARRSNHWAFHPPASTILPPFALPPSWQHAGYTTVPRDNSLFSSRLVRDNRSENNNKQFGSRG